MNNTEKLIINKVIKVPSSQNSLSNGDKFTVEGVGVDSLGREVIGGFTYKGKKAKGKVKLTVFTAEIKDDE